MLMKKLKKVRKECKKSDEPVLRTLAAYLGHVVEYLERTSEGDAAAEYGRALAGLDLTAVEQARPTPAVVAPVAEETPPESPNGHSPAAESPAAAVADVPPAEPAPECTNGKAKHKKAKKKARKHQRV